MGDLCKDLLEMVLILQDMRWHYRNLSGINKSNMGCGDSNMAMPPRTPNSSPVQNYNNKPSTVFYQTQNAKRPKFLNPQQLNQNQKETLWSIIQRNSLKEFAYYIQSQGIPSNMEIGPANTFWNFAHFCARWDAFECLAYMIKKVYAEKSTLVLSLMNQQTIEGYTAVHVAIQWNAINCFYVMLDHGGLDLSYTDKANNDVFAKANLFKRAQMLQVLERFKAGNALMVLVQSEKARGFRTFAQMVATGQVPIRTEYRITSQRIDEIIDYKNQYNKPLPPPPPVENNVNKYQNYQNAMKQIESQKNGTTATEGSGEQQTINRLKLEQQRKFQQQQNRIKKQQAEDLKRNIQLQKEQEEKRLRQETQNQINKERVFEQAELAKIEKEKEFMRKNIEAMHSNADEAKKNFGKTKMVCPEDIKPIYEAALAKGTKFVDTQFPAEEKSLGNIENFKFGWKDCVWIRPDKMFPGGKYEVFDGISPEDVKQGTLAVCYYLALLSSIAENEQRIKKIFRFYDKDLGFYALQFYMGGKPKTIIVDDFIPCMKGTNQPLFAKPRSPEVWVMIFEKAWVKLFGSYLAAEKMAANDMFENVIPAPCRYFIMDVSKIDQFYDKILDFDKKNYIMCSSTPGNKEVPAGLVEEHAYSLIGVFNINGTKICKIRNPWGKTQYSGMYAEASPLWTPELQKAVGFQKGDDGIFYLTPTELHSLMPIVTVSLYKDDYEYSYIDVQSKSNQQVYFIINIKKKGELAIKLTQQNERFIKNMEYENCPIRFELCKIGDNYDAKIISEGDYSSMFDGALNLYLSDDMYDTLEPGRYLIRLKVMYDRAQSVSTRGTYRKFIRGTNGKDVLKVRESVSLLSIYGPEKYVFNRITKEEGEKYMKNVYRNFILAMKEPSVRMTSTGQDLKPTVVAKDGKMRNQIIYMAENFLPNNSINFKFQFNYEKFRNCSFAYNVNKQTQACEWVIEPGGWNLATLEIDCPFQQIATDGELHPSFKIIR